MEPSKSSIMKFQRAGAVIVGSVYETNMLDALAVSDFGDEVIRVVEKYPKLYLMLNFEKVEFLSSAALSELIRIHEAVMNVRGIMKVCGVTKDILKVFQITKLDEMLGIDADNDVKTAVEMFRRAADRAAEERDWDKRAQDKQ